MTLRSFATSGDGDSTEDALKGRLAKSRLKATVKMVQRRLVAAKNNVIEQATFCRFLLHFAHHIILVLDRAFKDFQIGLQRAAAIIGPIVDTCFIVLGYLSGPGVDCGLGVIKADLSH